MLFWFFALGLYFDDCLGLLVGLLIWMFSGVIAEFVFPAWSDW